MGAKAGAGATAAEAPSDATLRGAMMESPSGGLPKRFLKDVHDVLIAVPVPEPKLSKPRRVIERAAQGH
jgi:hypothetical protein